MMIGRIRQLLAAKRGVAFTEFAISLPLVLTLGLSGIELVNLVIAHFRVNAIAMMTADNAARVRESIDEADIIELFEGAKIAGQGIDFAGRGRLILSDLEHHERRIKRQWIRWQRCMGAKKADSSYGFPLTDRGKKILNATELLDTDLKSKSPTASSSKASLLRGMGPGNPSDQISAENGATVMVVEAVYDYRPIFARKIFGDITIRYLSAFTVRERADPSLKNAGAVQPARCDVYSA